MTLPGLDEYAADDLLRALLARIDEADSPDDPELAVSLLTDVVAWLRPAPGAAPLLTQQRMDELVEILELRPEARQRLAACLLTWLHKVNLFSAVAELGLYSRRGFATELVSRIYEHVNPAPLDPGNFKDALFLIFYKPDDLRWVAMVPEESWLKTICTLFTPVDESSGPGLKMVLNRVFSELFYAIEMLSIWVAAEELDADMVRIDRRIAEKNSAFLSLQRELAAWSEEWRLWLEAPDSVERRDHQHALVLLGQSMEQVERIRRRAVSAGATIGLTHLLERLEQTLTRIQDLLEIIEPQDAQTRCSAVMRLFRQMLVANRESRSVQALWNRSTHIIARSVTENASDHGEHYVTRNRHEYLRMLGSSAGAGVLIAVMALLKIRIAGLGLGEGAEAVLVSLNYGIGFVLIHMLGFTIATKQPAMTASYIAQAIERGERGRAKHDRLARLLIEVGRSQFAAIFGNVAAALAVAGLIATGYLLVTGAAPLAVEKAVHLRHELEPFTGYAMLHAAIAGVWLFLSGLIAGYYDNRSAYLDLAARLRAHPLLCRLLPQSARERLGDYLGEHYGALAGNFSFGVLLGMTGYLGYLLSLPLDIRHVAFASANLAYAGSTLSPGAMEFLTLFLFVLLIGAVNLCVSFALALTVALKARGARLGNPGGLVRAFFKEASRDPARLLLPPPDEPVDPSADKQP